VLTRARHNRSVKAAWNHADSLTYQRHIAASYERYFCAQLVDQSAEPGIGLAQELYAAPFALLAHDGTDDPRFTYANLTAQKLWERSWEDFIGLPSRLSAEPDARQMRAEMLHRVLTDGYLNGYSGVRVAASGRRFAIDGAKIWNVTDVEGSRIGQAARIDHWVFH
jgi:hypothetical protein